MTIEVIDYVAEAKSRCTSIFKDSPLYHALVDSIISAYQDQQNDFILFSENLLNIDFAERSQLDFIGRIVGQPRLLVSFNTEPYFGFFGSYQSETFGTDADPSVGGIWNSYDNFIASTARRLTDEEYRRIIKARIISNNSNCCVDDLIEVVNLLTNTNTATVSLISHGSIGISADDTSGFLAYFVDRIGQDDELLPIAAGVSLSQLDFTG